MPALPLRRTQPHVDMDENIGEWLCFTTINNDSVETWAALACDEIRPEWKNEEQFDGRECMFALANDKVNWVAAMVWLGMEAKAVCAENDLGRSLQRLGCGTLSTAKRRGRHSRTSEAL